jgi:GDP-D-mannose dehydratase
MTQPRVAPISGVTGQDGAYLAELLLNKGTVAHDIKRRASLFNAQRVDHLDRHPHESPTPCVRHQGDLTDSRNLIRRVQQVRSDEIYILLAQSRVAVRFERPEVFVIAIGVRHRVRQFVQMAARELRIGLGFHGEGDAEVGIVAGIEGERARCRGGDTIVRVGPRCFRPTVHAPVSLVNLSAAARGEV